MALMAVNAADPRLSSSDAEIAFAFPTLNPGVVPCGSRVLVQLRRPMKMTRLGIILPEDTRETELYNTQVAKVIAMGPLAYRHRDSGKPWAEGQWCAVGDFVRISKFGGDRWHMQVEKSQQGDQITFALFDDHNILGRVEGDPLAVTAYL